MQKLKTLGLVLVTIIFVVAGGLFLLAKGVDKTFLQTSFYEGMVEEVEVSPLLTGALVDNIKGGVSGSTQELSPQQREEINKALEASISEAISEEWAEETILKVADDGLAYLKGEQEGLTAVIDLRERKQIIRESLSGQVQESVQVPERFQGRMTPQMRSRLESERNALLEGALSGIPNEIALSQMLEQHPRSAEIKSMVTSFQNYYGHFNNYSYPIMLGLVVLILLLAGILRGLKWAGTGMVISGFLVLGLLIGVKQALPGILSNMEAGLSMDRLGPFVDPFFAKMNTIVLYYTVAGLVALLLGIFIKKPKKE